MRVRENQFPKDRRRRSSCGRTGHLRSSPPRECEGDTHCDESCSLNNYHWVRPQLPKTRLCVCSEKRALSKESALTILASVHINARLLIICMPLPMCQCCYINFGFSHKRCQPSGSDELMGRHLHSASLWRATRSSEEPHAQSVHHRRLGIAQNCRCHH